MTTVQIDTQSLEAQKMIEFLKTTRYARILDDRVLNEDTLQAIEEIESGDVNSYSSVTDMMNTLRQKASV